MDNSNNAVYTIGICKEMCPSSEARLREKQGLLHILEVVPGTEHHKNPKADLKRVVKEFTRSAAGKSFLITENLRPPDVLLKTINYLLDEVISNNEKVPWMVKYDFILDRLRAVRQDMVIQNVSRPHQIVILQPIIRFLTYSSYRCCEEAINTFDPHINNTHLQECLKRLLCTYDYFDNLEKSSKQEISSDFLVESRPYFESLYLIFNLGDVNALNRYLNLPPQWSSLVKTSMRICLNYVNRNISKVIKLFKQLPLSLQMIAFLHMPEIRRITLKIMSSAYHSKNLTFPLDVLSDMLLYNCVDELIKDCNYYGLKIQQDGVHFMKSDFLEDKAKVKPRRSEEIDKTLKDTDISMFLLYGDH
ncbi:SAC3 domain-containing protein 1 isoform X2 [Diabrotica undecimpunctata]|uniref:SAC3 domain-containing protein 1 isoform X2 n=1 Tax=Diabrotica undecimpunctata TaxID=50387 RepID=UPI003B640C10